MQETVPAIIITPAQRHGGALPRTTAPGGEGTAELQPGSNTPLLQSPSGWLKPQIQLPILGN